MRLSSTDLARFDGGQIEVQNQNENYLYRGQIETARVTGDDTVVVTLAWMAKMGEDFKWHKASSKDYRASLEIYSSSDIGGGRVALSSWITGEMTVFYPPDYPTKLDLSKVVNA